MAEAIQAYPLQWPVGWPRKQAHERKSASFGKKEATYREQWNSQLNRSERVRGMDRTADLTIFDSIERVLDSLGRMGLSRDDVVISTNVETRLDGLPRSNARMPDDPGVAVYWRKGKNTRCMAIDRYDRVADNLAAIAATLEAMRAIERHGGAEILDRAFTGFVALPAPEQWFQVLGVPANATEEEIKAAHRRLVAAHPEFRTGGSASDLARINVARDEGLQARR